MRRHGVSALEIAVVFVILSVVAVLVAPRVRQSARDANLNQATFRLQTIRTAIAKYQRHHHEPPATLELLTRPLRAGEEPPLPEIPLEPLTGVRSVTITSSEGALEIDPRESGGGWLYNALTGEVRLRLGPHRKL